MWRGLCVPVILEALLSGEIAPGRAPYPWASLTGGTGTVAGAGDRAVQLDIIRLTSTRAGSGIKVLEWGQTLSFPGVAQYQMLAWTVVTGLLCSTWIQRHLWAQAGTLYQAKEFLVMSDWKVEHEIDRRFSQASAVLRVFRQMLWWGGSWVGRQIFQFTTPLQFQPLIYFHEL